MIDLSTSLSATLINHHSYVKWLIVAFIAILFALALLLSALAARVALTGFQHDADPAKSGIGLRFDQSPSRFHAKWAQRENSGRSALQFVGKPCVFFDQQNDPRLKHGNVSHRKLDGISALLIKGDAAKRDLYWSNNIHGLVPVTEGSDKSGRASRKRSGRRISIGKKWNGKVMP